MSVTADSIVGSKIYLCFNLALRPRVSTINYNGLKKSEREDLEARLGIVAGSQITPNIIDRAKTLARKYFDEKGYKNAVIDIEQRDDVAAKNQVILDINVDKKDKMKVRQIILVGNKALTDKKIKGTLFTKGAFAKTHEAGKLSSFLKSKKFTEERFEADKQNLIDKYNELGYRDMVIVRDSVWNHDHNHVNILVEIDEGQKYYIRNITWVGNTVASTDYLNRLLGMKKGDVYNQKHMKKRLEEDEDAVGNYYWNNGYLFYQLVPTEVNVVGDSIDLEMRIEEGPQAHIRSVRIFGNDRLYEEVVRRELRTKPGDLFSKDALMRSAREIASMGFFDPEKVNPDIKPNGEDGTVDINWELEQKSNDQVEFSLGWGQTGVIGRISLKLNNFSMRNLFGKNKMHRGIMPIGDGEQLALSVVDMAKRLGRRKVTHHDSEWLVAATFATPKLRDGRLVGSVAGKVESAEPLDGNDAAVGDKLRAPLDDAVAGGQVGSRKRLGLAARAPGEVRPAGKAGVGLRVEAPIEGVGVFGGARRAQGEHGHGGARPVVGQLADDGVARPAVGAVDEGVVVASVGRIKKLTQAVGAGGDVG